MLAISNTAVLGSENSREQQGSAAAIGGGAVAAPETRCDLPRELGVRDLTLFGIVCILGPRWIPAAAHMGPGSITLWLLAAILFGVPLAVAVAALMAKYPGAGGLYTWTRNDFGPAHGFISFGVYWVGIAFFFPSAAIFYLSSSAYTFGSTYTQLADSAPSSSVVHSRQSGLRLAATSSG